MTRYRKKPVEVEAWQVGSDEPMPEWIDSVDNTKYGVRVTVANHSVFEVIYGDWMVKDKDGIYVLAPYFFAQTYEAVNDAED